MCKLGWLILPLVLLVGLGAFIEHGTNWKAVQDPRNRLLWDGQYDGSDVVIIGSSTFNSSRVDRESQSLWSRLAVHSGKKVFSGSLDGAQTADVLSAAKLVAATWPAGSTVFVDVPPTKFVYKIKTSAMDTGNYASRFENLTPLDNPAGKPGIYLSNLLQPVNQHLFIYRNLNEVGVYLKSVIDGQGLTPLNNNRVWTQDQMSQRLFWRFSGSLSGGTYMESYDKYFLGLQQILQARQIRLVFVLTGLNKELIRRYSDDQGARVLDLFEKNRQKLTNYLGANQLNYIDATDAVPVECFADMVHSNACGDDALARQMSNWLAAHPVAVPGK